MQCIFLSSIVRRPFFFALDNTVGLDSVVSLSILFCINNTHTQPHIHPHTHPPTLKPILTATLKSILTPSLTYTIIHTPALSARRVDQPYYGIGILTHNIPRGMSIHVIHFRGCTAMGRITTDVDALYSSRIPPFHIGSMGSSSLQGVAKGVVPSAPTYIMMYASPRERYTGVLVVMEYLHYLFMPNPWAT